MKRINEFTFIDFQKEFHSEKACEDYLFKTRYPNGYECPRCGHQHYYLTRTRKLNLYECKECRYQTTVTAGTILERTRTDLRKWFWAIYLLSQDKRGVSALLLQKQIGVCYTTAWTMLHKIRKAMTYQNSKYSLAGLVELDDSYFGSSSKGGKRGRGTAKTKVVAGISLDQKDRP